MRKAMRYNEPNGNVGELISELKVRISGLFLMDSGELDKVQRMRWFGRLCRRCLKDSPKRQRGINRLAIYNQPPQLVGPVILVFLSRQGQKNLTFCGFAYNILTEIIL